MIRNTLLINKSDIKSKVLGETIFNLLDKTFVIPRTFDYRVVDVTKDYISRMDLVSRKIYGTPEYQDVLCKLNGISNPYELNEHTKLIIPEFSDITRFFYFEDYTEKDPDSNGLTSKPVAKGKKEKRKPNEAVVGDKRYKIDKNRRVIIY